MADTNLKPSRIRSARVRSARSRRSSQYSQDVEFDLAPRLNRLSDSLQASGTSLLSVSRHNSTGARRVRVAPAPGDIEAGPSGSRLAQASEAPERHVTFKQAAKSTITTMRLNPRPSSRQVISALQQEDDMPAKGKRDINDDPLEQLIDAMERPDMLNDSVGDVLSESEDILRAEAGNDADLDDDIEDRYFKVYHLMLDALHGQSKHGLVAMAARGPWHLSLLRYRMSYYSRTFFTVVVALHAMLVYIEEDEKYRSLALTANYCIIAFYASDVLLKMWLMKPAEYISKRWNRFTILFNIFFLTDAICLSVPTFQPFRLLRPWMLLTREKEVRRLAQALASRAFYRPLLQLLLGIALFVLLFAAIGVHVFARDYHNTCQSDAQAELQGIFDNSLIASVHMFTLVTTESYPEIMLPAWFRRWESFLFFGLFLMIGVFFIVPMSLAVVTDSYWTAAGLQYKKDRKKERLTLIKAFNLLDPEGQGFIEFEQWYGFMKYHRPELNDKGHMALYSVLTGGDKEMGVLHFIKLREVVNRQLTPKRAEVTDVFACGRRWQLVLMDLINSQWWQLVIRMAVALYFIMFCLKRADASKAWEEGPKVVQTVLAVIFLIDILLKGFVRGWQFERGLILFGVPINVLEFVLMMVTIFDLLLYWTGACNFGVCTVMGSVAQFLRLLYKSPSALVALQIFDATGRLILKLIILTFFVSYTFAILYMEAYSDLDSFGTDYCASLDPVTGCKILDESQNFESFGCSWLIVFQIITTSNWHEIMAAVMEQRSRWDSIPFILCYSLSQYVMLSLMVGTAVENLFRFTKARSEAEAAKKDSVGKSPKPKRSRKSIKPEHHRKSIREQVRALSLTRLFTGRSQQSEPEEDDKPPLEPMTPPTLRQDSRAIVQQRERIQKRQAEAKANRKARKQGKLPSRCVAIKNEKAHGIDELPLVKGDVIEILAKDETRYRGKCAGRSGWFQMAHVMVVLDEDMIKTLQSNSTEAEYDLPSAEQMEEKDEYLVQNQAFDRHAMVAGKITEMNPDELMELNRLANANLLSKKGGRRLKHKRQSVAPREKAQMHDAADLTNAFGKQTVTGAQSESGESALSSRHVSEASQHQHLEERSPGRTDSDMKRVQFDRYVKQQDGSVKDQQRAAAKAKMKEDGKPPDWFTKLAQKREVQIVEGRLDSEEPAAAHRRATKFVFGAMPLDEEDEDSSDDSKSPPLNGSTISSGNASQAISPEPDVSSPEPFDLEKAMEAQLALLEQPSPDQDEKHNDKTSARKVSFDVNKAMEEQLAQLDAQDGQVTVQMPSALGDNTDNASEGAQSEPFDLEKAMAAQLAMLGDD